MLDFGTDGERQAGKKVMPIRYGLDFVRGRNWEPIKGNRAKAQRLAERFARQREKLDGISWAGCVWTGPEYYRINLGYQADRV